MEHLQKQRKNAPFEGDDSDESDLVFEKQYLLRTNCQTSKS